MKPQTSVQLLAPQSCCPLSNDDNKDIQCRSDDGYVQWCSGVQRYLTIVLCRKSTCAFHRSSCEALPLSTVICQHVSGWETLSRAPRRFFHN